MKPLSVKEIHKLANAIVSVEYTEKARVLLDRFEAREVGLDHILTELRSLPSSLLVASNPGAQALN